MATDINSNWTNLATRMARTLSATDFSALEAFPYTPLFANKAVARWTESNETHRVSIYCSAGLMVMRNERNCYDPGIGTSDHYCEGTSSVIVRRDGWWNRAVRYFSGPDVEEKTVGVDLIIDGQRTYYDAAVPMDNVAAAQSLFDAACK